jgi:hypothetical protein
MRTQLHPDHPDRGAADSLLVDLQPRQPDRAEQVKGGYDEGYYFMGRAARPPSRRSGYNDWW